MTASELDIVLPVYNEAASIESTVRAIDATAGSLCRHRFVIVEDGSADETSDILRRLARELPVTLDTSDARRGYSTAMRTALGLCSAPYVLCIDSDGQYDPEDIPKLWQRRGEAAIVSGWRQQRAEGPGRRIGSAAWGAVFRSVFPVPVHDPSSSMVLMTREVVSALVPRLRHMPDAFWWEVSATAHRLGFSFVEVPVRHRARTAGATQIYTLAKLPRVVWRQAAGLTRMLRSRT